MRLNTLLLLLFGSFLCSSCLRKSDDLDAMRDQGCDVTSVAERIGDELHCVPLLPSSGCPQPELSTLNSGGCEHQYHCVGDATCVEGCCQQSACVDGETRACASTECGQREQTCVDGAWTACVESVRCGSCEPGEVRSCTHGCGEGTERCFDGEWRGCDATKPSVEVCRDLSAPIDEDCDGKIDEGCRGCQEEGSLRGCETSCGVGAERCINGHWGLCDAPAPELERCDGQDNDCDGRVDEDLARACNNRCGPGAEVCEGGAWVGCEAPERCRCDEGDLDAQVCGMCGMRTRACEGEAWGEWGVCQVAGQCDPGELGVSSCGLCGVQERRCTSGCQWEEWGVCQDEGVCVPGEESREPCGAQCGERVRVCTEGCRWGEWSECIQGGVCEAGAVDREACQIGCGERTRVCLGQCQWSDWEGCDLEDSTCLPGHEEERSCGECSSQTRLCSPRCEWGAWSECALTSCEAGERETRGCGLCGQQVRTCDDSCAWSEWSACRDQGVCSPGDEVSRDCGLTDVGECQLGTRIKRCDDQCRWVDGECLGEVTPAPETCGSLLDLDCDGELNREPDVYEPNNTCELCTLLPEGVSITNATIDVPGGQDYFCVEVDDQLFDLFESLDVTLSSPTGRNYDLYLYKTLEDCQGERPLESSTGSSDEALRLVDSSGSDDSGTYIIQVKGASANEFSCEEYYELTIDPF